nr:hypothetical protein [Mycobacterium pseudoshottsii]
MGGGQLGSTASFPGVFGVSAGQFGLTSSLTIAVPLFCLTTTFATATSPSWL